MTALGFDRLLAELDAETARLSAALADADPDAMLPTCPDWRPADLVTHIGRGHRWAASLIESRATSPVPIPSVDPPSDLAGWLREGAALLAAAARSAGAQAPVWTWSYERTAGFWLRRMLHDTLIHRVDVELATGGPSPIAPDLAADGVTDLLQSINVLSRDYGPDPIFAALRGAGETLHFHATDADGEWLVIRGPSAVHWEHGHNKADVAVRGPAAGLLIVLNRRATPASRGLEVLGDSALFDHWLANSKF